MSFKQNIEYQYCKSPIGELIIGSYKGKLCLLDYKYRKQRKIVDSRLSKGLDAVFIEKTPFWQGTCVYLRVRTDIDVDYFQFTSRHADHKETAYAELFE